MKFFLYLLIILCVILIIIVYTKKCNNIEKYDALVDDTSFNNCAFICKMINNCTGFGYDDKNKKCYLANKLFDDIDNDKRKYVDFFDKNNALCYKIIPIKKYDEDTTYSELLNNAIYKCNKQDIPYLFVKNSETVNIEVNTDDTYKNSDIKPYKTFDFNWNTNRFDNMLPKHKISEVLNNILSFDDEKVTQYKQQLIKENNQDYIVENDKNNEDEFKKYANLNKGEYLFPYHCIDNISMNGCSMKCKKNNECVGFDYNTDFNVFNKQLNEIHNYNNLCCLKKNIGPFVERVGDYEKYKNGSFYLKKKYADFIDKINNK